MADLAINSDDARAYLYKGKASGVTPIEVCQVDSRGPGLQLQGTNYALIGVTSTYRAAGKTDVCGETGKDTRLAGFDPWLRSTRALLAAGGSGASKCQ